MRLMVAMVGLTLCLVGAPLAADDEIHEERVEFAAGESGASVEGSIVGYGSAQYTLGAAAGQTMRVELMTEHTATYFNVWAPGTKPGEDAAMFIGSTSGSEFEGELPEDGDYMVQVYMMRSAARRDEQADFTLEFEIE